MKVSYSFQVARNEEQKGTDLEFVFIVDGGPITFHAAIPKPAMESLGRYFAEACGATWVGSRIVIPGQEPRDA